MAVTDPGDAFDIYLLFFILTAWLGKAGRPGFNIKHYNLLINPAKNLCNGTMPNACLPILVRISLIYWPGFLMLAPQARTMPAKIGAPAAD